MNFIGLIFILLMLPSGFLWGYACPGYRSGEEVSNKYASRACETIKTQITNAKDGSTREMSKWDKQKRRYCTSSPFSAQCKRATFMHGVFKDAFGRASDAEKRASKIDFYSPLVHEKEIRSKIRSYSKNYPLIQRKFNVPETLPRNAPSLIERENY